MRKKLSKKEMQDRITGLEKEVLMLRKSIDIEKKHRLYSITMENLAQITNKKIKKELHEANIIILKPNYTMLALSEFYNLERGDLFNYKGDAMTVIEYVEQLVNYGIEQEEISNIKTLHGLTKVYLEKQKMVDKFRESKGE